MHNPRYPRARLSPAKDELLVLAITRESVVATDTAPLLEKLAPLAATREEALAWEGKLTFCFEGWDDDPRETAEIPEIRRYFQALTADFPFWLHFAEKIGDTFWHAMRLLCRGRYEALPGGMVGWRFDDMRELIRQVNRLFAGMNVLYGRLELPEETNRRVSEEVAQLIECSLE
jgi:hypothetical protein